MSHICTAVTTGFTQIGHVTQGQHVVSRIDTRLTQATRTSTHNKNNNKPMHIWDMISHHHSHAILLLSSFVLCLLPTSSSIT